jgi:hypothetical protein
LGKAVHKFGFFLRFLLDPAKTEQSIVIRQGAGLVESTALNVPTQKLPITKSSTLVTLQGSVISPSFLGFATNQLI